MGLLKSAMVVAALVFAAPAWAGGGHDRDDRRGGRHYGGYGHDHRPDWRHHRHHHRHGYRPARQHYYSEYYYAPPPVYGYAAPAPGVHVVAPNIYIPFR